MSKMNCFGDMFSCMLFPNEIVGYDFITKNYLASFKLDGVRCVFKNGHMLSRSLKEIPNKQLQERFEHMKKLSEKTGIIYDGEIYSKDMNFQEIMHFTMTDDLEDESLPESLVFNCFDICDMNNPELTAISRYEKSMMLYKHGDLYLPYVIVIEQRFVSSPEAVKNMFEEAINSGFEGLILKDPNSAYKYGRLSIKSKQGAKFKPYETFDGVIFGVEQSTKVDPNAEKKINELGHSKTSQKKGDRILIEKASAFWVKYNGKDLKVTIATTDEEKEEIWKNREDYMGRTVEYKAMMIGAKDVPRHPIHTAIRMRPDKDC